MTNVRSSLRYYLLVAGVGLLSGSIAIAFYVLYMLAASFTQTALAYSLLVLIPLAFAAITIPYLLVKEFAQSKSTGSGTHTVLEAYHLTNGNLSLRDTVVKPAAAMLTIGLGGSAGPEGPSLFAGGGVASVLARRFHVQADLRRRLFIAGAAAGLAATFRTPLTAILFALEIPYKNDLDRETFIEAVIASVPAYLVSVTVLGSESIFGVIPATSLTLYDIGLSLVLGLICGLYAIFFTKTFAWTERLAVKLRKRIGGLALTVVGAVVLISSGFLSLYTIGVGLNFVQALLSGAVFSLAFLVLVVLVKTFVTAATLNFGAAVVSSSQQLLLALE
jgi:CIC family chloride channel protein